MAVSEQRRKAKKHAIERAFERYGLTLSDVDVGVLNAQIRDGRAHELPVKKRKSRKKRNVGIFIVDHNGVELPVMFNGKINSIVTVLAEDTEEVVRLRRKYDARRAKDVRLKSESS